jgi:hypothetical protein
MQHLARRALLFCEQPFVGPIVRKLHLIIDLQGRLHIFGLNSVEHGWLPWTLAACLCRFTNRTRLAEGPSCPGRANGEENLSLSRPDHGIPTAVLFDYEGMVRSRGRAYPPLEA